MHEIWSWFAIEVEWASAILDFLGKIAWPVVLAILLWRWRDVIKDMLADRDLESLELTLSGLILKRSVAQSLDEAEQSLAEEKTPTSPTPSSSVAAPNEHGLEPSHMEEDQQSEPKKPDDDESVHTFWRLRRGWLEPETPSTSTVLSEASWEAAATGRMLIAYKDLDRALRDAIKVTGGIPSPAIRSTSTLGLAQIAQERGLLPESWFKAFNEVRKIRNELIHRASEKLLLTDTEVVRFVNICSRLIMHLSAAVDFWEPLKDDKQ